MGEILEDKTVRYAFIEVITALVLYISAETLSTLPIKAKIVIGAIVLVMNIALSFSAIDEEIRKKVR